MEDEEMDKAQRQNAADAQVVAQIMGRDVTRGDLNEAFERIKPRGNWKNPIRAKFTTTAETDASAFEVAVIREAVIFFTGSVPEIFHEGNWRFSCSAIGYYAAVGA